MNLHVSIGLSELLFLPLLTASWVPAMDNPGLFEGDMVLSPEQVEAVKNGGVSYGAKKNGRWPKTSIAYELTSDLKGKVCSLDRFC